MKTFVPVGHDGLFGGGRVGVFVYLHIITMGSIFSNMSAALTISKFSSPVIGIVNSMAISIANMSRPYAALHAVISGMIISIRWLYSSTGDKSCSVQSFGYVSVNIAKRRSASCGCLARYWNCEFLSRSIALKVVCMLAKWGAGRNPRCLGYENRVVIKEHRRLSMRWWVCVIDRGK